jgi:hypothetical protein
MTLSINNAQHKNTLLSAIILDMLSVIVLSSVVLPKLPMLPMLPMFELMVWHKHIASELDVCFVLLIFLQRP